MTSSSNLPFVLAGPILKRTSKQEMWIWFATSSAIPAVNGYSTLLAECYSVANLPSVNEMLLGSKANKAVGTGVINLATDSRSSSHVYCQTLTNLHIYLVKIEPVQRSTNKKSSFPVDELLCYELFIHEEVEIIKNGKPQLTVVKRGLHEHLYANRSFWKDQGANLIQQPVGLRGYSADKSVRDPNRKLRVNDPDWEPQVRDPNAIFQYDRVWLKEYSKLWGVINSTLGKSPAGALPTTLISSASKDVHFWSGSCFKLHGEGESATFLMHDDRSHENKSRRVAGALPRAIAAYKNGGETADGIKFPQALILTGDQIYADDVAFLLTDSIRLFAEMLGDEEESVGNKNIKALSPSKRLELSAKDNLHTPFSTNGVYNHVLTFAEYCAYHLLHMNAAIWPDIDLVRDGAVHDCKSVLQDSQVFFRIDKEKKSLESNRFAVRSYSAVQSCVPTYALCDDHDVTDDWFMDGQWMAGVLDPNGIFSTGKKTKHSELGCRVIANALGAYAAMHGIGNDPDRFRNRTLEVRRFEASKDKSAVGMPEYSRLLRLLTLGDWSFDVPLSKISAFCLDTRTHRLPAIWLEAQSRTDNEKSKDYYRANFYGSADKKDLKSWAMSVKRRRTPQFRGPRGDKTLVEFDALKVVPLEFDTLLYRDRLLDELISRATRKSDHSFLLITPAPVCSIDVIEERKSFATSKYIGDAELWRNNLSNFYRLIEALLKWSIDHCVIVSGDVHNANRRNIEVCAFDLDANAILSFNELEKNQKKGRSIKLSQIVTSPLLNRNPSWLQRVGGTPDGRHLKPSTAHVAFSRNPGTCISIEEIEEWKISERRYRETTIPICLKNQNGIEIQNKSDLEDDYYSFENNFASITLTNSGENVHVQYYFR